MQTYEIYQFTYADGRTEQTIVRLGDSRCDDRINRYVFGSENIYTPEMKLLDNWKLIGTLQI